jgi:hypothetical protein
VKSFKLDLNVYVCVATKGRYRRVENPTHSLRFAKSFCRSLNRLTRHCGWHYEVAKISGRVVDAIKNA